MAVIKLPYELKLPVFFFFKSEIEIHTDFSEQLIDIGAGLGTRLEEQQASLLGVRLSLRGGNLPYIFIVDGSCRGWFLILCFSVGLGLTFGRGFGR